MDIVIQELIKWIHSQETQVIIGVTGHGGAGKTAFAARLQEAFGQDANLICTDPYIVNSALRRDTRITYSYQNETRTAKMTACHPLAHYVEALERDLQMTRLDMEWNTIDTVYLPSETINPYKKLTVVEGMSVAFINPKHFDLQVFLYTDGKTELARRSSRDTTERNQNLVNIQKSHQERRVQYRHFMHPYKNQADIILFTDEKGMQIEKKQLPTN
ncbi:uridine kinase [Oceanobacillus sp. J11TS1]|uniref:uridine kinase family protein n=1 Tax=Oceanobacillus sp. J11TS1 TaxID=2807191 RepID=UPI001B29E3B1|nr:phosphoribulokinase [Oceanobacillus sp. J11TS1]GIO23536.1 uridine kinase [Oceanobacillus sp. J11TS1]